MKNKESKIKLASIKRNFWELESGVKRHKENPKTFEIPSSKERKNLKTGQAAKLIFQIELENEDGNPVIVVERMWVIVIGRLGKFFRGILSNRPAMFDSSDFELREGAEIIFRPKHVISIDDSDSTIALAKEKYGHLYT